MEQVVGGVMNKRKNNRQHNMKSRLTAKEEDIMQIVWDNGDLFIRDIVAKMREPKPNYNTVATQVKFLEEKGFLGRRPMANSFQYTALISEKEYRASYSQLDIEGETSDCTGHSTWCQLASRHLPYHS